MNQEELLKQLKVRDFEQGFEKTPLREFTGKLENILPNLVEGKNGGKSWVNVGMNFSDVKVIMSTEPYQLTIAQIEIPQSNREQSLWGIFGGSIGKLIPATADMGFCIQKYMHMKMTSGHMLYDGKEKKDMPRDAWECMALSATPIVVGQVQSAPAGALPPLGMPGLPPAGPKAPANAVEAALALLDGRTEQEWQAVVFNDAMVKSDGNVVNAIIARTFLNPLALAGKIIMSGDMKYHVVK